MPFIASFFFTLPPVRNPNQSPSLSYHVPTLFLREILWRAFRGQKVEDHLKEASKFAPFPQVLSALYEPLVLNVLQFSASPSQCHIIDHNGGTSSFSLGPNLRSDWRLFSKDVPFHPASNTIYVPLSGFYSLDAFVVSEDGTRVTMLQMTIGKTHSLKASGVRDVIKAFRGTSKREKDIEWSFLFATPGDTGEKIARKQRLNLGKTYPKVNVGWMVVGLGKEMTDALVDLMEYDAEGEDEDEDEDDGQDGAAEMNAEQEGSVVDVPDEDDDKHAEKRPRLR